MADSVMVSNVGPAAINILVIQVFNALAADGTIICSQYIGRKETKKANEAASQLVFIITVISVTFTAICVLSRGSLLRIVFGKVDQEVMDASHIYFLITVLFFLLIAFYNVGSSVYRTQRNTRLPMPVAIYFQLIK